jgi:hypothetical protein
MIENFRRFEVRDPFKQVWDVEFLWLQTGISIRHSDSVDVKFALASGAERMEKVIALPYPHLLEVSGKSGHPVTDPWCSRLAALHLARAIETGEDMEKAVITVRKEDLEAYSAQLRKHAAVA